MIALLCLMLAVDAPALPPEIPFTTGTNPTTFSLTWFAFDKFPGIVTNRVYVIPIANTRYLVEPGGLPNQFKNSYGVSFVVGVNVATNFLTTTNYLALPGLNYGQLYWIQGKSIGTNMDSDLSPAFVWPPPLVTYYPLTIQSTTNFTNWVTISSAGVVVTSPPEAQLYWRMEAITSNNVTPYQKRDDRR